MVRVLAVADEVSDALWGARAAALAPDLVLAAGDLPWDYLEFLASVTDRPVVFVPGNHDPAVVDARAHRSGQFLRAGMPCEPPRPAGCRNADGTVLDAAGLRIAGLGGCVRYRPGPNQYSQREFHRRAARLLRRVGRLQRRSPGPSTSCSPTPRRAASATRTTARTSGSTPCTACSSGWRRAGTCTGTSIRTGSRGPTAGPATRRSAT